MKSAIGAALVVFVGSFGVAMAQDEMERGDYLANGIVACGNCHTPQGPDGPVAGMEFAGQFLIELPEFKAYAPNITPDAETGIGRYSREDLKRAIRDGVRPDGTVIGPPMPIGLYRDISDSDLEAIVTYVMSVAPVRNEVPASEYRVPLPPAYGPAVVSVPDADPSDATAYGRYLGVSLGHCVECHSPVVDGVPDLAGQMGAGGQELPGPWGVSVSSNITPHPSDGIARYSDADLKTVIRTGIRPDGTRLLPPMGVFYYASIDDADIDALVAWLRTLEPKPSPR